MALAEAELVGNLRLMERRDESSLGVPEQKGLGALTGYERGDVALLRTTQAMQFIRR